MAPQRGVSLAIAAYACATLFVAAERRSDWISIEATGTYIVGPPGTGCRKVPNTFKMHRGGEWPNVNELEVYHGGTEEDCSIELKLMIPIEEDERDCKEKRRRLNARLKKLSNEKQLHKIKYDFVRRMETMKQEIEWKENEEWRRRKDIQRLEKDLERRKKDLEEKSKALAAQDGMTKSKEDEIKRREKERKDKEMDYRNKEAKIREKLMCMRELYDNCEISKEAPLYAHDIERPLCTNTRVCSLNFSKNKKVILACK